MYASVSSNSDFRHKVCIYSILDWGCVREKPRRVSEMRFERLYLAALSGSQIQAPGSAGGTVTCESRLLREDLNARVQ